MGTVRTWLFSFSDEDSIQKKGTISATTSTASTP